MAQISYPAQVLLLGHGQETLSVVSSPSFCAWDIMWNTLNPSRLTPSGAWCYDSFISLKWLYAKAVACTALHTGHY